MANLSVKEKLLSLIKELNEKNMREWTQAASKSNFVVSFDLWSPSSRIQWTKKGTNGTTETRYIGSCISIREPCPKKDMLYLVYLEGNKEFEGKDLSDDCELIEFFTNQCQNNVSLFFEEDVLKLFEKN